MLFSEKIKHYVTSYPYSFLKTKVFPFNKDISDFFIFRLGKYNTVFIGENSLALSLAKKISCKHIFHFFDLEGNFINRCIFKDNKFHFELELNSKLTNSVIEGIFTHHVEYDEDIKKTNIQKNLFFQHRGYCGYKKDEKHEFSYVHGNFGGAYIGDKELRSIASKKFNFSYTPQLKISKDENYEFFFTNPSRKKIKLTVNINCQDSSLVILEKTLKPFATEIINSKNHKIPFPGTISFVSSLPIGRCLIFENKYNSLDVFHG